MAFFQLGVHQRSQEDTLRELGELKCTVQRASEANPSDFNRDAFDLIRGCYEQVDRVFGQAATHESTTAPQRV